MEERKVYDTVFREILFRAKSIETGEWIVGNYHHNVRKGTWHGICDKDTNEMTHVFRESLQMKNWSGEWENV